ncbi:MAG: hypothetical protein Q7T21_00270 [Gallionella sp.]|nr:hypothetical protein [Gallionella sp.]
MSNTNGLGVSASPQPVIATGHSNSKTMPWQKKVELLGNILFLTFFSLNKSGSKYQNAHLAGRVHYHGTVLIVQANADAVKNHHEKLIVISFPKHTNLHHMSALQVQFALKCSITSS